MYCSDGWDANPEAPGDLASRDILPIPDPRQPQQW